MTSKMGWKRRRVVRDGDGRLWMVKRVYFVPGHGIRVHVMRPRSDSFMPLTLAVKRFTVIGEL